MALITKLGVQKKNPNRVNVYLDGKFAFGCNKRVIERFELKPGMELSPQDLQTISQGELQQKCFDRALLLLTQRMHSRAELRRKLASPKSGFPAETIDTALEKLAKLGYLDDAEFARQKLASSQRKLMGQRRVFQELRKSGVDANTAQHAVEEHFRTDEAKDNAELLIQKNLSRLQRLDPITAKRRLIGLLQRRGFDYETTKPLVERYLGELNQGEGNDQ